MSLAWQVTIFVLQRIFPQLSSYNVKSEFLAWDLFMLQKSAKKGAVLMMVNKIGIVFLFLIILLLVPVFLFFRGTMESKIAELSHEISVLENMLYETKTDIDKVQKTVEDIQESVAEIHNNVSVVKEVFQQAQNLQSYMLQTQPRLKPEEAVEISYALIYYARIHNLDPHLAAAVAEAESTFSPRAVSPKGAKGLMQLMPGTARMLKVNDPLDIYQNIAGGIRYLAMMVEEFGDLQLALAAYNTGPARVHAYRGIPPFWETQRFLSQVDRSYTRLDGMSGK